jgi:hypothetical protein
MMGGYLGAAAKGFVVGTDDYDNGTSRHAASLIVFTLGAAATTIPSLPFLAPALLAGGALLQAYNVASGSESVIMHRRYGRSYTDLQELKEVRKNKPIFNRKAKAPKPA